eukprot:SAG31_NODE_43091_length_268_cov_1.218935_1_plen_67_part_01
MLRVQQLLKNPNPHCSLADIVLSLRHTAPLPVETAVDAVNHLVDWGAAIVVEVFLPTNRYVLNPAAL